MTDEYPKLPFEETIATSIGADRFVLSGVLNMLLGRGILRHEDIQSMYDNAPDGDVGTVVQIRLEPFLKAGSISR